MQNTTQMGELVGVFSPRTRFKSLSLLEKVQSPSPWDCSWRSRTRWPLKEYVNLPCTLYHSGDWHHWAVACIPDRLASVERRRGWNDGTHWREHLTMYTEKKKNHTEQSQILQNHSRMLVIIEAPSAIFNTAKPRSHYHHRRLRYAPLIDSHKLGTYLPTSYLRYLM